MKQIKPFTGKWRIAEMEVWDQDYVDMEEQGYIRIGSDGTGQFQFGLVSGDIDGRVEQCGSTPRFKFSWSGQDENDRRPAGYLQIEERTACCRDNSNTSTGRRLQMIQQPPVLSRLFIQSLVR